MFAQRSRSPWAVLALLTVAGAALRLPLLGNQSVWYDETFTRGIVTASSIGDAWHGVKATEATPPLYYLLTWGWAKVFGIHSDAALRATSAIAGVAAVPAAFAGLRRLIGDRAALAAAALAAASPMLVWYSLDARSYSLLVLLALLSLWPLSLLLERPTWRRWAAWALCAVALLWTHYFAVFLVAGEVAVLLWRLPAARVRALAWTGAAAVLAAPLIPVISAQSDARTDHIGSLPLGDRIEQTGRQLVMGPNVPRAWLEGLGLLLATAGIAAAVLAARRSERLRVPLALAAATILLPLLLSITGIEDRLLSRNELVAWPALAALAAVGLLRARAVPLAVLLVAFLVTTIWVAADWRYQNPDWEGAAHALDQRANGNPIAVFPALSAPVAAPYLHRLFIAPGPLVTHRLWMVVEPERINRRDLVPVTPLPKLPPSFVVDWSMTYHGFHLVEVRRPGGTVPVNPIEFGHDVLGARPELLEP